MWYNQDMEIQYQNLKTKAIALRKQGLSYGDIKRQLNVSKSTLSLWLKHIALSPNDRQRLYTRQIGILNLGAQSQRSRREREVDSIIKKAKSEIKKPLGLNSYRIFGAALYWAEGSKGKMFLMTNSDPSLILFWVKWLHKIFKLPAYQLKARLNMYPQQNETSIKRFWSELTGIPIKNFGKSYIKPLSKNYKTNNLYYGTIRIEVPKSTDLRHRVFGWTQAVLSDIAPTINMVERKWEGLKAVAKPANLV
jgi:hypothetical protein